MDSEFENLAYQERLIALASLKSDYVSNHVTAIDTFANAEFDYHKHKGFVLNL